MNTLQHLVWSHFLIFAHLLNVRFLILVWIFISLLPNEVKHLFIYLAISYLWNVCSYQFFFWLSSCLFLLLICRGSLWILDSHCLSRKAYVLQIFSLSLWLVFFFLFYIFWWTCIHYFNIVNFYHIFYFKISEFVLYVKSLS